MGKQVEEEEEEEEEKAAESLLLTASTCSSRCSHSEIWTSFLWFFLVFGVWVLPCEMASTMSLYSTLSLVRRWTHAHASVYVAFGRFLTSLWCLTDTCSASASPDAYRKLDFLRSLKSDSYLVGARGHSGR